MRMIQMCPHCFNSRTLPRNLCLEFLHRAGKECDLEITEVEGDMDKRKRAKVVYKCEVFPEISQPINICT